MPARFCVLGLAAAGSLAAQYAYYLPQIVDGVASNGSIRTTFVIANVATTAANVKIGATRDDATVLPIAIPGIGTGANLTIKLAPGATRLLTTDGSGDGSSGAAVISSDAPLKVSEILVNTSGSGDPLSESAVPGLATEDLAAGFMVPVDATVGFDSGIALFNPGTAAAQVTMQLLDPAGVSVNSTTVSLRAGGRMTFFGSLLAGSASGFRGTLDVSSSLPLAGVAVRQNSSSPNYTLLPPTDKLSLGLHFFLPRIADGQSDSGVTQTIFPYEHFS
jgi:hypothetical protein